MAPTNHSWQIQGITDETGGTQAPEAGRSVTYTYDPLGRLKTAVTDGTTAYPQWGLSFDYDRWGNRGAQSVTAGTAPPSSLTFQPPTGAPTNRILDAGYGYDLNGNLTSEPTATTPNNYTWDGEDRLTAMSSGGASGTYSYDGNSLRVKKVSGSTTTVYVFSGSKVIAEYVNGAPAGSPTREYVYSGATLLAAIEGSWPWATTKYHHADHLSVRVTTNSSGAIDSQQGHFPFGESWYAGTGATKWQFTSYERDSESGNDYAMFRYDSSRMGRFLSPDLLAGSPVDPRSLNRYAYVRNNPVNGVDPLGLEEPLVCPDGGHNCPGGGGGSSGGSSGPVPNPGYTPPSSGGPSIPGADIGGDQPRSGGGTGMANCGIDIYCRIAGGIGPFGSPVANGGSWKDGILGTGGAKYYTILPNGELEVLCVARGDKEWECIPVNYRVLGLGSFDRDESIWQPGVASDVPLTQSAQIIFAQVGQTTPTVIHPCTVVGFYAASAGAAGFASISTTANAAGFLPELGETVTPLVAQANWNFLTFMNRGGHLARRALVAVTSAAGSAVQYVCH